MFEKVFCPTHMSTELLYLIAVEELPHIFHHHLTRPLFIQIAKDIVTSSRQGMNRDWITVVEIKKDS